VITTAVENLNQAHRSVFAIAQQASVMLAGYEGTGATLTRSEIAVSIGIDVCYLKEADRFLVYLALDAALEYRGWSEVPSDGDTVKRFRKAPKMTTYRKPATNAEVRRKVRA
jgi:hypothetical protein